MRTSQCDSTTKAGNCPQADIIMAGLRLCAALLLASLAMSAQTIAATFIVTNTLDSGAGSLRNAISNANASPGPDNINCTGLAGTITLASPLPELAGDMTIAGPGASVLTISGSNAFRVLQIDPNTTISILDLTIANGYTTNIGGAGILNGGNLSLLRCSIIGNRSISVPGGGILNQGTLTLNSSLIASNLAGGGGSPFGPIVPFGRDASGLGGGISVQSGTVRISNCSLTANRASGSWICMAYGIGGGGAIFVQAGQTTVANSTLSSNRAIGGYGGDDCFSGAVGHSGGSGSGGAIFMVSNLDARVTSVNCTFSGNLAAGGDGGSAGKYGGDGGNGYGGAISAGAGNFLLVNCTLYQNLASGGAAGQGGSFPPAHGGSPGFGYGSGLYAAVGGGQLLNCILQSSYGEVNSRGYNLLENSYGYGPLYGLIQSDQVVPSLHLGPLANNGGPTLTHSLPLDSPALDNGNFVGAPAFDQRGTPRPQGLGVDIGAVEVLAGAPQIITTSSQGAIAGDDTFITMKVFGAQPLLFQWFKEGAIIPGANSLALNLNNVSTNAAGSYTLVLSNSFGSITSPPIALTITSVPPLLVRSPAHQYSILNGAAQFCVTAAGSKPLTYQWLFNGTNLASGGTPSLVVSPVRPGSLGGYSVQVSNFAGAVTSSVALLSLVPGDASQSIMAWGDGLGGATTIPANLSNVVDISAGNESSLALKRDGTMVGWGQTAFPPSLSNVVQIAAGYDHNLALRRDGTVVSWGGNDYGQTNVPPGLSGVKTIAAGHCASMALLSNGTVLVWGNCANGENNPPPGLTGAIAGAAGWAHCLVLRGNGTVAAWGEAGPNTHNGQTNVPLALSGVTAITAGPYYSVALKEDGSLVPWGAYPPQITSPLQTTSLCGLKAIRAGNSALLGLHADGTLEQWGGSALPTNIWSVSKIAAGASHFLALGWMPFAPEVVEFPTNQTVIFGSALTLSATIAGTQPLFYQWRKDGENLRRGTNAIYQISNVGNLQAGAYTVMVTNLLGAVTSAVAQVTVLYPIQMTVNGGGTVSKSPDSAGYAYGQRVALTAIPGAGWRFLQWRGDVTGQTEFNSLVMTRPRCAQAEFGTALITSVSGNGAVLVDPPGGLYPFGIPVTVTAMPQSGSYFLGWGNAASGANNPLFFPVTGANPTLTCSFAPLTSGQFALTVIQKGQGQIDVAPQANHYASNATVTLTARAESDQSFLSWSGDVTSTQNPLVLSMNQSKLIAANFTTRPRLSVGPCRGGWGEGGFQFTLLGEFGGSYQIQGSADGLQWTLLATATNTFDTFQFTDSSGRTLPYRFFRAILNE